MKYGAILSAVLLAIGATAAMSASAAEPQMLGAKGVVVGTSYQNDVSLPLYYLPEWQGPTDDEGEEREAALNPKVPNHHIDSADPVVQHLHTPNPAMPSPILSFNGIPFPGVGCNCAPPDTDGEVGDTQYVQMVNEGFQVFDKATGNSLVGPTGISALWSGFGGVCETSGHGDPVVLYDQLANRWLISQFAGSSIPTDECVAISTTSDATGSYFRYGFHLGTNFFDYPHLGVWTDGYYMAMNVFNSSGTAFLGPQPFVFDRNAMLSGNPATFITTGLLSASEDPILPADLDGSVVPPLNAPETFVEYPGNNTYKVYHFHTDWTTPANSTFTQFAAPAAAGFSTLCPNSRACVPQLGGTGGNALDGIGDRLMFRLAYRNFGDHESVVGNYTVNSSGVAGIRWFELRGVTAGPVAVFQESTYQPDTTWRWMGSAAMDSAGNLAVGFSASDATINPQIRYAGRLASDPLNQLAQGEAHLFDGTGSQQGTSNRWGDYSDLTVDPVDDCTFWYTQEYYATSGQFNWRTRIGNFKFAECGTPGFTLAVQPQAASVCAGTPANFTVNVGSVSDFDSPVTLSASGNPSPTTVSFTPNPVTPLPGSSAMQVANTAGAAAGVYPIDIDGTATGADNESTTATLSIFTTAPPAATLTAPANGANGQPVRPTFTWTGSNSESYTIDIATDAGFSNIVFTQTVAGTTATPNVDLASNTQFFWRVTAANACGGGATSAVFSFTTQALAGDCSTGTVAQTVYQYGFESGLSGWTLGSGSTGNTWADNTSSAHSGTHSWKADDPDTISDQRFISPSISLPSAQDPVTLQFWHKRDMEPNAPGCYDGGILEVSTNGGSSWTQLDAPDLLTDPYNGPVNSTFGNPLAGLNAWCDVQDWTDSIVDVTAYAGQNVQFRFRLGSDESVSHDGWYLDDVKVQSCVVSGNTHVVTPVAGPNGSIVPSTPQNVVDGNTIAFTVTPDTGFSIDTVTGCGGNLAGNVYTTGAITADCTVNATFRANDDLSITIDDGRGYAAYGMSLTYTIVVANSGTTAASGVSISNAFPAGLDISQATWTCAGGAGVVCTASGTGALTDSGVTVPASGSVTYTLIAPVLDNAAGGSIVNAVTLTAAGDPDPSNNTASDEDFLVIFRGGFEAGDDGAVAPKAAHR